jgi:hypothetical protein
MGHRIKANNLSFLIITYENFTPSHEFQGYLDTKVSLEIRVLMGQMLSTRSLSDFGLNPHTHSQLPLFNERRLNISIKEKCTVVKERTWPGG